MDALSQFIATTTDARELKRALAVQMRQQGYPYQQVESLLQVSESFISKSQQLYCQQGINAFKLGYWGTRGYLNEADKQAVFEWVQQHETCQLEELIAHIDLTYGVVFKSQQSYYDLLHQPDCRGRRLRHSVPIRMTSKSSKKTRSHGVTNEMANRDCWRRH